MYIAEINDCRRRRAVMLDVKAQLEEAKRLGTEVQNDCWDVSFDAVNMIKIEYADAFSNRLRLLPDNFLLELDAALSACNRFIRQMDEEISRYETLNAREAERRRAEEERARQASTSTGSYWWR